MKEKILHKNIQNYMFSYCYFSFSILYFKFGSEGIVNCFAETFKRKFDPLHPTDTRRISYELCYFL